MKKSRSLTLPTPLKALRTEASTRWQALPPRERLVVSLAAVLIGIALLWMLAVAPALRTLREAPALP